MDQDRLAGIGNIYANDALYLAKIHPMRKSKSLTKNELKKLIQAIERVINEGLKYNGSSDESYILPDSSIGQYQKHFKIYGKEGEKCSRCKAIIKRIKHAGRSYFFCSRCQRI
jgi:formamidopyrimidine-DNA glycosylase